MIEYSIVLNQTVVIVLGAFYAIATVASFWILYIIVKMVVQAFGKELKDLF